MSKTIGKRRVAPIERKQPAIYELLNLCQDQPYSKICLRNHFDWNNDEVELIFKTLVKADLVRYSFFDDKLGYITTQKGYRFLQDYLTIKEEFHF